MLSDIGIVERDIALQQSAHEHETTARTVVLVLEIHVGWTGLQAEAAVHARIETGCGACQRRAGNCTSG